MNLKEKRNAFIMAPEETPPNREDAVHTVQGIPLKHPPWNEWLRLARQGDEDAKLRFCTQAEPFISRFCNIPLFAEWIGRDEARGIATLVVIEFLMEYDNPPEDREIPYMLKRQIRNRLIDQYRKLYVRNGREKKPVLRTDDDDGTGRDNYSSYPANKKYEPEATLLAKELHSVTADTFRQLQPHEQNVLRAFFFQNKTAAAIAKELQCTRQNVEKLRNRALRRLRQLLEGQHICGCGA